MFLTSPSYACSVLTLRNVALIVVMVLSLITFIHTVVSNIRSHAENSLLSRNICMASSEVIDSLQKVNACTYNHVGMGPDAQSGLS